MVFVYLVSVDLLKYLIKHNHNKKNNPNEEAFRRAVRNFVVDLTLTCTIIFIYEGLWCYGLCNYCSLAIVMKFISQRSHEDSLNPNECFILSTLSYYNTSFLGMYDLKTNLCHRWIERSGELKIMFDDTL
jgi:hypothetical protein